MERPGSFARPVSRTRRSGADLIPPSSGFYSLQSPFHGDEELLEMEWLHHWWDDVRRLRKPQLQFPGQVVRTG